MQKFNSTPSKTREALSLEKSLSGVLHTVKESEEHIRYSRPRMQTINKLSFSYFEFNFYRPTVDLIPDGILLATMNSHLRETRDHHCTMFLLQSSSCIRTQSTMPVHAAHHMQSWFFGCSAC